MYSLLSKNEREKWLDRLMRGRGSGRDECFRRSLKWLVEPMGKACPDRKPGRLVG